MSGKTIVGIGIVVIIGIFILGYFRNHAISDENQQVKESYPTPTESVSSETPNAPLVLQYATITVPETEVEVTLEDGQAEFTDGPVQGSVALGEVFAEWPTDMGINLYGILYVNMGGSGTFAYLALFQYFADATVHHSSALLGDRIIVETIVPRETESELYDYETAVNILERGPEESMTTEPTIPAEKLFGIKDHKIVEEITQ